jgi:hypothetical protein
MSVGLVAKSKAPDPVSPVTAAAKFVLEGVAKKVATPVPRPLTPVLIGNPVQLVSVPELGVPRFGVVNIGEVRVLLVKVCVAVRLATAKPPAVDPSWTLTTFKSVSTDNSPVAPVNELFCAVVPRLNCTTVGISCSYILLIILGIQINCSN